MKEYLIKEAGLKLDLYYNILNVSFINKDENLGMANIDDVAIGYDKKEYEKLPISPLKYFSKLKNQCESFKKGNYNALDPNLIKTLIIKANDEEATQEYINILRKNNDYLNLGKFLVESSRTDDKEALKYLESKINNKKDIMYAVASSKLLGDSFDLKYTGNLEKDIYIGILKNDKTKLKELGEKALKKGLIDGLFALNYCKEKINKKDLNNAIITFMKYEWETSPYKYYFNNFANEENFKSYLDYFLKKGKVFEYAKLQRITGFGDERMDAFLAGAEISLPDELKKAYNKKIKRERLKTKLKIAFESVMFGSVFAHSTYELSKGNLFLTLSETAFLILPTYLIQSDKDYLKGLKEI